MKKEPYMSGPTKLLCFVFTLLLLMIFISTGAFGKEKVTVDVAEFPPMIISEPMHPHGNKLIGFDIELWEEIAKEAEIDFKYRKVPFDQIIPNLKEREADVGLAGISIRESREKDIDFSYSYFSSGLLTLVRSDTEVDAQAVVDSVFNSQILSAFFYLFLFVVACGHLIWYTEQGKESSIDDRYFPGIFESFWWAFVTMTTVGYGDIAPKTWIGRGVAVVVMFSGIVFFGWWVGTVSSAVSTERLKTKIERPEDLRGLKVATKTGTTSAEEVYNYGANPKNTINIDEAYHLLENRKVDAVVFDAPSIMYHIDTNESPFEITGKMFAKQDYGIALQQDSPLKEKINRALLKIKENGTYDKIYRRWFGNK